ncbi:uncharacterized protein LOC130103321 [Rhinichthys klamathensis goyatoka]|uniref:uncharacterized protein LOC130103321 n=1 Tax=Rhinichthys klamathensis goyatoka TaxID=3034132 RepID=UPI0024B4D839|nr:uncharacterized protein LOC130103321 [Rhinichthys klamathensis goyatoka]
MSLTINCSFCPAEDFSLVIPSATVSADPGADVILPVHLSPETSVVSMNISWYRGTDRIYQYMNGLETTDSDYVNRVSMSIQELERGNFSLTLRNVQPSDSGGYRCNVYHYGCMQTGTVHLQVRELRKSDGTLEVLQDMIRKLQDDILQQKTDLPEKTLKLLQEALKKDDKDEKRKKKPSVVGEDSTTETELMEDFTLRSRGSLDGLPPLMARESGDQNTRPTREENTGTEQEFLAPAVSSSLVLQTEHASVYAIMQERRQESVATEQVGSSSSMQSQVQESERTSQSVSPLPGDRTSQSVSSLPGDTTQTPERSIDRTQMTQRRRQQKDNKCSVM